MNQMKKSNTVYHNSASALSDFQEYLKSSARAAALADIKTKALTVSVNLLSKIGWMAIISGVTFGITQLVSVIDEVIVTAEEAKETFDNAVNNYKTNIDEIDNLNEQLKNTREELDQLQIDGISIIEEEEYQRLLDTNEQLARTIELKKIQRDLDAQEVIDGAEDYYNKLPEYSNDRVDSLMQDYKNGDLSYVDLVGDGSKDDLSYQLVAYDATLEKIAETRKKMLDIPMDSSDYEYLNSQLKTYEDYQRSIQTNLLNISRTSQEAFNSYKILEGDGYAVDDDIMNAFDNIIDIVTLKIGTASSKISTILKQSQFEGIKEQLVNLGKDGSLSIDVLAQDFPALISELADAGVEAENLYNYILQLSNPDLFAEKENRRLAIDKYASGEDKQDVTEWINDLNNEDLKLFISLGLKEGSLDDYKRALSKAQKSVIEEINTETQSNISTSVQQMAKQLQPQFAQLGEAYQQIFTADGFTLDNVNNEMLESLRTSFNEIEEEIGVAFDPSATERFFDVISNGKSTSDQVQQAFNDLATAYFYSTDTLKNLNVETALAIEKQLEEMGVTNAHEVVVAALAQKELELAAAKKFAANSGKDLETATASEILAFTTLRKNVESCSQEMLLYYLNKALCADGTIETKQDCLRIYNLAEAANVGTHELTLLSKAIRLVSELDEAINSGDMHTAHIIETQLAAIEAQVANGINVDVETEVEWPDVKGAGSAGKEAADEYLESFEKELAKLDSLYERGKLDEKSYLDAKLALARKYFKDREKYIDNLKEAESDYLKGKHTCPTVTITVKGVWER